MASLARRVTAWTSLAALVVGLAMPMLPWLHAAATGPDDCAAPTRRPGELRVDVNDPADRPAPGHCVMCHWLRTARSASTHPPVAAVPVLSFRSIDECRSIRAVSRLVVLEGPSRAPPAAS
jgi:hypothetical protein